MCVSSLLTMIKIWFKKTPRCRVPPHIACANIEVLSEICLWINANERNSYYYVYKDETNYKYNYIWQSPHFSDKQEHGRQIENSPNFECTPNNKP